MRLGSIRYLRLGSSLLVARAGLETRLGNRQSAQYSAWPNSELGLGSAQGPAQGSTGDWLGARDSGFDSACLSTQLGSFASAWCLGPGRGWVRFGNPVRLETQGSTQDSALGLDRSPARSIRFGKYYKRSKA